MHVTIAERGATWRGMAKDKFHVTTQFAALPWRISEGGDASGHVANITRDTPLGYPKGLAHEETETRRGGEPRGIRGGGLNRSDCGQAAVWTLSLREAG